MKTTLKLALLSFAACLSLATTATAGNWRVGVVVGNSMRCHTSCGCPVYVERYIAGFDACGYPVYGERFVPVRHRCRPLVAVGPPRPINPRVIVPRHPAGPCVSPPPPCVRGGERRQGIVIAGIRFR